jgi:hypothetical protein
MPALNVNIVLHGLFFMTQEGTNLRVYAPNIANHYFVGGIRGSRTKLASDVQDLTGLGLKGKAVPEPDGDVDGSIMQFPISDVGGFNGLTDTGHNGQPLFKGSILVPWPLKFIGLRAGDISGFRTESGSIADHIVANARRKNKSTLGVVALLQYALPALNQVGGISQLNIHYYLQPCLPHEVSQVNADLIAARSSFKNGTGFDLQMLVDVPPPPIPPGGHLEFGTTKEDEQSFDEERLVGAADVVFVCRNDPLPPVHNVSPANCPIFFVGS